MDLQILSPIISGSFSLLTGLASIWLRNRLERDSASEHGSVKPKYRYPGSRVFVLLVIGLILGAGGMASRRYDDHDHYGTLLSLGLIVAIALFLAINHRKSARGFWPYQLGILSLWFAYGTGFSLVRGNVWEDLVIVVVGWWIGSAIVGGIIAGWKKKAPMKYEELPQKMKQQPTPSVPPAPLMVPGSNEAITQTTNSPKEESPLDIVKRRYALGEITKEQFDQMKEDLK